MSSSRVASPKLSCGPRTIRAGAGLLAAALVAVAGGARSAEAACAFRSLGPLGHAFGRDFPRDLAISGDGGTIVGSRDVVRDFTAVPDSARDLLLTEHAFRWRSPCQEERLPWAGPLCFVFPNPIPRRVCEPETSFATALSRDGSIVVGSRGATEGVPIFDGFRWEDGGSLEGVPASGFDGVIDVSADGSVLLIEEPSFRFQVISAGQAHALDFAANALSADGSTAVGEVLSSSSPLTACNSAPPGPRFARYWTAETGTVELAGPGTPDFCGASARLASEDGSIVLGSVGLGPPTARRFMTALWEIGPDGLPRTDDDALTLLDPFGPHDLTPDGTTAVGARAPDEFGNQHAVVWDAAQGVRPVSDIAVNECGFDLTGWQLLQATGISDDGTRLVGTGWDPSGQPVGWLLDLSVDAFDWDGDGVPEPDDNCGCDRNPGQEDADGDSIGNRCDADFDQTGQTTIADLVHFLGCLGGADPLCDLNADGLVGRRDLRRFGRLAARVRPGPSDLRERTPVFTEPGALNSNAVADAALDVAPTLATDGAGTWVGLWPSNDPLGGTLGADFDLLVARSTDGGATWSTPAPLHPHFAGDSGGDANPQLLAVDGAGLWVAAWQSTDPLDGSLGTDSDILYSRSSDAGLVWSAPRALQSDAASDDGGDVFPQLAGDPSGRFVAVWERAGEVRVAHSGDGGATWSASGTVVPGSPLVGRNPHVATDGAGTWVVIWQDDVPLSRDFAVRIARSIDGGATWSTPRILMSQRQPASVTQRGPVFPRVANDGHGRWLAAWRSAATAVASPLEFSRSRDGLAWSKPRLLAASASTASAFELVSDGRRWIAVWSTADPLRDTIGRDADLLAAVSPNAGGRWHSFVLQANAALDAGADTSPQLVPDGAGGWMAVWQSNDDLGGTLGADFDILHAIAAP